MPSKMHRMFMRTCLGSSSIRRTSNGSPLTTKLAETITGLTIIPSTPCRIDRTQSWVGPPPIPLENLQSLHRDRLGEVARLIDVGAHHDRRMVGDQLHRNGI